MSDNALRDALIEAWICGYQQAIDTLRDMAGEIPHEEAKDAILILALILEATKP